MSNSLDVSRAVQAALVAGPAKTRTKTTLGVIDVGRCPDASEPTIVGTPPPEHLPYQRRVCALPDLADCTADDLSDLAANALHSQGDLDILLGSSLHVLAILRQYGLLEVALDDITDRNAVLERQLATRSGITAEYRARVPRLEAELLAERDAHQVTTLELESARADVSDAHKRLSKELERCTREVLAHTQTIGLLATATAESYKIGKRLEVTEALRVSALQEVERLSGELAIARVAMGALEGRTRDLKSGVDQ